MPLISSSAIDTLHRASILRWNKTPDVFSEGDFLALVEKNHAFNYQLWNAEDRARRDDQGHEFVYQAKREIDQCNQKRNNCMEAMDEWLFRCLQPADPSLCPVHSETPGMMIDRLSILALKVYHMGLQAARVDVDESHRQLCHQKMTTLLLQQQQLLNCFDDLLTAITNKTRTFRVYHQFKMYNDPTLNPQLYQQQNASR